MSIHRDDLSPQPAPEPGRQSRRPSEAGPAAAPLRRADSAAASGASRAPFAHDISPLLRAAAAAEHAARIAVAEPERPRRRSRRRRDYFVLLLGAFGAIAALVLYAGLTPLTLSFGIFGMIVFTSGLTWVVFGIMDDY